MIHNEKNARHNRKNAHFFQNLEKIALLFQNLEKLRETDKCAKKKKIEYELICLVTKEGRNFILAC